jgi:hypothetical protein
MYRNSAEAVKLALELAGPQSAALAPVIPPDGDLATISQIMADLVAAHEQEPTNDYREIIMKVAEWVGGAADKAFFLGHLVSKPHSAYVLRKGLEVLHMMIHRDLRRRALSNSESQVYYDFVRLTTGFARPPKLARPQKVQIQS